jgi:hypothetical protein
MLMVVRQCGHCTEAIVWITGRGIPLFFRFQCICQALFCLLRFMCRLAYAFQHFPNNQP